MYVSADGTGVPMRRKKFAGRKGKQPDGTAKTRQVYLECVFTQHCTDEKGHPVRDYESTTFVSDFQAIDQVGRILRQEALHRGLGTAGKVVLLIDGAVRLKHIGQDCFKDSVQIVDFYNAMEHAGRVLDTVLGKNHADRPTRQRRWAKRLLKDKVQSLLQETRQACLGQPQAQAVEEEEGYFERNIQRRQYGFFRAAGCFIGSRCHGSRMQNGHQRTLQTIRHVLVLVTRGKCSGLALHSQQSSLRLVLERQAQPTRQTQRPALTVRLKKDFVRHPFARRTRFHSNDSPFFYV
jgi:hypothetical protein